MSREQNQSSNQSKEANLLQLKRWKEAAGAGGGKAGIKENICLVPHGTEWKTYPIISADRRLVNFTVPYILSVNALEIKSSEHKDKSVSQAWEYWISVAMSGLGQTKTYCSLQR